jgi:hypothetical protein
VTEAPARADEGISAQIEAVLEPLALDSGRSNATSAAPTNAIELDVMLY